MKSLYFALLCTISLFHHTNMLTQEHINIAQLQEHYFTLRKIRDTVLFPAAGQALQNMQANPDCLILKTKFRECEDRLNAFNKALFKLRQRAFPKEIIIIHKN